MPDGLPRIALLATGGTIAGVPDEEGGYRAGVLAPDVLLQAVPGLSGLARLRTEQIASVGSQNMSAAIWTDLASRILALFERDEADGVVVTHGTDTIEETAYFLSLVLPAGRPVVLVGAMRPAGVPGADGPANLQHAVALAASRQAAGRAPLVVMNEQVYSARDVQKISASGISAFAAPNGALLGQVFGTTVVMYGPPQPAGGSALFPVPRAQALPRVDILYAHADQNGDIIDWLVEQGARGLVLAGVGAGNATDSVLDALRRAARRGVAVVRSSRTGSGYVGRNAEVDDDACGFVAAGSLGPAKARILLMLALQAGAADAAAVQAVFDSGA